MSGPVTDEAPEGTAAPWEILERIAERILWLSSRMIHEANVIRPNPDQSKVGGHQASSASVVSILTTLYFSGWLRAEDRVSIKPHASPAYHAVQYLLGNLDRSYLTGLRAFGGLQAYPSRTKDPDPVDFSTGSVGLGAVAPLFASLAERYLETHALVGGPRRRFIAVIGDAELDEGNIWEAMFDEIVSSSRLGNVLWIVDLNRQSLDRVIPGVKVRKSEAVFRAAGWQVLEAKYGHRLQEAFTRPGGVELRRRIDEMSNELYQEMIRMSGADARAVLLRVGRPERAEQIARAIAATSDDDLPSLLADLGGHDPRELYRCFLAADAEPDRPAVLFAYTIKGRGLPTAGDPMNHSLLLSAEQMSALAERVGVDPARWTEQFDPGSPEGEACRRAAARLRRAPAVVPPIVVPGSVEVAVARQSSSQDAFGQTLVATLRSSPDLARRIVTASPDVSISTGLGSWINRVGVWSERAEPTPGGATRLLRWEPGPAGQHIELGISEMNLFSLLGQLGLTAETLGEVLVPVGAIYDPFVCRGLDALIYGLYSGAKFVFAGTPAGVSLSPEGGAHQSSVTVSLGMELPDLQMYEPCFAREVSWCLLDGLRQCLDRTGGWSTYLRLSTKPVDQSLLDPALARLGADGLRAAVLRGGYRLVEADPGERSGVILATAGALVPDTLAAARELKADGIAVSVLNLTSAGRLYREWQAAQLLAVRLRPAEDIHLGAIIPASERTWPIVTVLDGASHAFAFLGAAFGQRLVPLGVDRFGQSGTRGELYAEMGIDAPHIVNAALIALGLLDRRP